MSDWDAFRELLRQTTTPAARKVIDPDMHGIVQALMRKMYTDAVGPNGEVDLTKVKKWRELNEFRPPPPNVPQDPLGLRLRGHALQNHHTVPQEWARILYREANGEAEPLGGWEAWLNDMPGIWLHQMEHHAQAGSGSFHEILHKKMVGIDPNDPNYSSEILQRLGQAYQQWNPNLGPDVWAVAKKWLQDQGVAP